MVGSTLDEGRGFVPLGYDLDGTPMTEAEYIEATKQFIGPQAQPLLTGLLYPSAKMGSPSLASSQIWTDAFACLSSETAKRASSFVPAYVYEFADRTAPTFLVDPFMDVGAHHGTDLMYWFQQPVGIDHSTMAFNPAQKGLSDQMVRYWKAFAESGNPNSAGNTAWPLFNKLTTPVLTLKPDAIKPQEWGTFQRAHQCGAWSILFALRSLGAV
jgi:para-nitrobenzyl esterase